jgi:hypothetical protein
MNGFFANLVARHLGTCDTVKPRTLGRFEPDHGRVATVCPDEVANSTAFERNQTLQPPSEAPYDLPNAIVSEVNSLASSVPSKERRMQPRGEVSVDSPAATGSNSDLIENQKDVSAPFISQRIEPPTRLDIGEQQVTLSDTHVLPELSDDTHSSDTAKYDHRGALEQAQPNRAALVGEKGLFAERHEQTTINNLHEVTNDKETPPARRAGGEHHLEPELNHRIRAMLQRLAGEPVSPSKEPTQDDQGNQRNETQLPIESQMPIVPETAGAFLDAVIPPLDLAPASSQKVAQEERDSTGDRKNTHPYGGLEVPSWLSGIEAQFKQRLQEKEAKPEPVINVTIGRVEVRAVQANPPTNGQRQKKPTGVVMTLDKYLKQREGRGAR